VEAQEDVLDHVLGRRLVPDQQHGQPDQGHAMSAEQAGDDLLGRSRGELSSSCHTYMTRQPRKC
jgi:hypothetical protein